MKTSKKELQVRVGYATEFGPSESQMSLEELVKFAQKRYILSWDFVDEIEEEEG